MLGSRSLAPFHANWTQWTNLSIYALKKNKIIRLYRTGVFTFLFRPHHPGASRPRIVCFLWALGLLCTRILSCVVWPFAQVASWRVWMSFVAENVNPYTSLGRRLNFQYRVASWLDSVVGFCRRLTASCLPEYVDLYTCNLYRTFCNRVDSPWSNGTKWYFPQTQDITGFEIQVYGSDLRQY